MAAYAPGGVSKNRHIIKHTNTLYTDIVHANILPSTGEKKNR